MIIRIAVIKDGKKSIELIDYTLYLSLLNQIKSTKLLKDNKNKESNDIILNDEMILKILYKYIKLRIKLAITNFLKRIINKLQKWVNGLLK